MFVFMYVFAAAFIWLCIYMIRKGRESIVMSLGEVMVIEKDQHKDEHAVGHATELPGDNIHSASFEYSSVVSGGQRTVIEHGNKNVAILMSRIFTGIGTLVIAIVGVEQDISAIAHKDRGRRDEHIHTQWYLSKTFKNLLRQG